MSQDFLDVIHGIEEVYVGKLLQLPHYFVVGTPGGDRGERKIGIFLGESQEDRDALQRTRIDHGHEATVVSCQQRERSLPEERQPAYGG